MNTANELRAIADRLDRENLAAHLADWLARTADNPRRWDKDPVGRMIRDALRIAGHWKNKPRGKPNLDNLTPQTGKRLDD